MYKRQSKVVKPMIEQSRGTIVPPGVEGRPIVVKQVREGVCGTNFPNYPSIRKVVKPIIEQSRGTIVPPGVEGRPMVIKQINE